MADVAHRAYCQWTADRLPRLTTPDVRMLDVKSMLGTPTLQACSFKVWRH
jgi:hypothetical protein